MESFTCVVNNGFNLTTSGTRLLSLQCKRLRILLGRLSHQSAIILTQAQFGSAYVKLENSHIQKNSNSVFYILQRNFLTFFIAVTYEFHSESTLYSCLNIKGLLAQSRRHIWSLSDSNGMRTHKHLVRKWLNVRLRTKWLCIRIPVL